MHRQSSLFLLTLLIIFTNVVEFSGQKNGAGNWSMDIFLIINNLLVLFAMIAVGFLVGRSGKLSDTAFSDLTSFLMQVTLPCMIFSSMQRTFDWNMLKDSVIGLVLSLVFTCRPWESAI